MNGEKPRSALDVSKLPTVAFGHTNVSLLGNVFYMTIEGTMFAMVIATYLFLRTRSTEWPPGDHMPPALRYGMINAVVFIVSVLPARWIKMRAVEQAREKVQLGLMVLSAFGVVAMVFRVLEFGTLNCRWSDNAYASCLWVVLGLHSGHLITEWIETVTLLAISFTGRMRGMTFADASINSDYWYFVVATALLLDLVIYGTARWF